MKNIIKLTQFNGFDQPTTSVLVGTESIIVAESFTHTENQYWHDPKHKDKSLVLTKIKSRGAMVETIIVLESIDEIYNLSL